MSDVATEHNMREASEALLVEGHKTVLRVNVNKIPDTLKERDQWVLWQYTNLDRDRNIAIDKATGKPKLNKIPKQPNGHNARSNDSRTWASFTTVINAYKSGRFDGIGFVFSKNDDLGGLDFDDCIEDGTLNPLGKEIVGTLGSYAELSPSGKGLHIIFLGKLPEGKRETRIEKKDFGVYTEGRYFTVTGHPFNGNTIIDNPEGLRTVYEAYVNVDSAIEAAKPTRDTALEDDRVIQKARAAKNGEKFMRLYYDGDTSGYMSQSEADYALCHRLCFWCGDDPEKIDRLFRGSALYRPKWDERNGASTYGERTVAKVISHQGDVYSGKDDEDEDEEIPENYPHYLRATEILTDGDPIKFILDTFGATHVGDRDVGEGLLLGTAAQSVENSLGVPSKLTGDSGKGKSDAAKKMMHLHPHEYVVYASLTDKAIWYHPNLKQGATIFSDDVKISDELEGIIKRATSNFQRPTERILPTKDKSGNYEGTTQTVPARLNWLLTSVRTQGGEELIKRQMGYDVDTSKTQDDNYIAFVKKGALKATVELPITEDVLTCREIIRILKETEDGKPRVIGVDIPFSERIEWTDTENRRNFNIFMDMVRSFAMFRFMQRERSEDGNIIASEADFNDAKRHYSVRAGMQALHLDETQKKFCQHLAQIGGEADTATMQALTKLSRQSVYKIADSLESIYWRFSSEMRSVPTDDDEKKKTNKRFYVLNFDGRTAFSLDEYSGVVSLKSETEAK